jgi:hypothetical protein
MDFTSRHGHPESVPRNAKLPNTSAGSAVSATTTVRNGAMEIQTFHTLNHEIVSFVTYRLVDATPSQ